MDKNMIVISDDEEDIIEIKNRTKEKVTNQQKEKTISISYNMKDNNSDSEDDVHVVEEVSYPKKTNAITIGSFGMYQDVIVNSCPNRRRVKPDLSAIRSCAIRRTISPNNLRFKTDCLSILRNIFIAAREESIRLEERRKYLKLLQSLKAEKINSRLIRPTILPSSSASPVKQRNSSHVCKKSDIPFVDLTSDSENDMVDVEKVYSDSQNEVEVESDGSIIHDNDLVETLDRVGGSTKHVFEKEVPKQRTSFKTDTSSDSDDNNDQIFDLVEKRQDQFNLKASKKSCSLGAKDPRGNLEEQMLQQMNIADKSPEIIEVLDDDRDCDADVSHECVVNIDDNEEQREVLPRLTEEMELLVMSAFENNSNEILVEGFNLVIRHKDIHTLKGSNWLNDEIINFYICLLMERGKLSNYPSVYCFNTFFYVKLVECGHASLKRWTRKVDIFSYDLIIVPVHLKVHWCLACINFPEKRIEYYDSMGGKNEKCGAILMNYLQEEYEDKKSSSFNCSGWKIVCMEDIPEQLNGSDCGVFVCTYAEYICRLAKFTFTQRDMPYFRFKMAYEILSKKLLL